jgi:hypothetical protein
VKAVRGIGWEEADEGVGRAGSGDGDGDPTGLRPLPQHGRWPSVDQRGDDGFWVAYTRVSRAGSRRWRANLATVARAVAGDGSDELDRRGGLLHRVGRVVAMLVEELDRVLVAVVALAAAVLGDQGAWRAGRRPCRR